MLLHHSPTIDEPLEDSLVQAVMRADGVQPQALRATLTAAANRVAAKRPERGAGLEEGLYADSCIQDQTGWRTSVLNRCRIHAEVFCC